MTTPTQINDASDARKFILGGNSTFTIVSKRTGTRFTYKVTEAKESDRGLFFVGLMNGPDNEGDYAYIGLVRPGSHDGTAFQHGRKSKIGADAPSVRAVSWFLAQLWYNDGATALATCEFWHEGRCGCCGRKLTVPSSIARGIGPECAQKSFMCEAA